MKKIVGLLLLTISFGAMAQVSVTDEKDKCGIYPFSENTLKSEQSTINWGYSFADLQADLATWANHEFVKVNSIGKSVQNRDLYMLTIQKPGTIPKFRISIHARTHPSEEESFYVTREIINLLLSNDARIQKLIDKCVFTIIPMYNPDGVELNRARENANNIDIESNWASATPEPEVAALKAFFSKTMNSETPIDIALNMHAAYNCTRYFVCHSPNGTSQLYYQNQQRFVQAVQTYFPGGVKNYDYFVSWGSGTPNQYPESWFWRNYTDRVLALTYEDMNCATAGDYDKTGFAILSGISDYLMPTESTPVLVQNQAKVTAYPNPISGSGQIFITLPDGDTHTLSAKMIAANGTQFELSLNHFGQNADVQLPNIPSGVYFLVIQTTKQRLTERILVI